MHALAPPVLRALSVPLATRSRRGVLWVLSAAALAVLVVSRAAFGLVGVPPTPLTHTALDVMAVGGLGVVYVLLAHRTRELDLQPLRSLGLATGALLGLAVLQLAIGMSRTGHVRAGTWLPADVWTVGASGVIGAAEGLVAVTVLLTLRPLLLYQRKPAVVIAWRVALGAAAVAALALAGRSAALRAPVVSMVFDTLSVLAGLGLALRQGAVSTLDGRARWKGVGLALALVGAVIAVQIVRQGEMGSVVVDGTGLSALARDRIPYVYLFCRPIGALFSFVLNVASVFAVAALLALLIGLPGAASPSQRAGERRALQSLADLSGRVFDPAALAAAIARGPVEAGLADSAWLALSDPSTGSLVPVVQAAEGLTLEMARGAADADALVRSARTDGALVLARAAADHRVHVRPGDGVGSLAIVPIVAGARSGALMAARRSADAYEAEDLLALETFAGQAGLALSHAGLFAEALDRERLARELALAREVQQRLFPQSLPEVTGLGLAAAERPAREVGGDYYDAVSLGTDCVGLLVADVSGKGAAAAFYMAEMKGIVQAASRLTRSPGELLAQANEALASSLGRGAFVSAVYAVVDAEAGTVAVGRAGHCPPILARDPARPDGGRWLLRGGGLAIGLDRGPRFRQLLREQAVTLAPGDALVLYTDGVVEVRDPDGEEYGYERMADFVAAHRHLSALELRDALLAEHRSWAQGADPLDDLTLLVLKWDGRPDVAVPSPMPGPSPITDRPAFP